MRFAIICMEFATAQRMRSLAEGLAAAGHQVTYVTAEPDARDPRYDVVAIPFSRAATRVRASVGIAQDVNLAKAARERGRFAGAAVRTAAHWFEALTQSPDKYRAWIPEARSWLKEHSSLLQGADVIVASTPPPSALFIGAEFAAALPGAVLVCDFRDLWTDNPSYPYVLVRRAIDRRTERRVMRHARAAITATQSLADTLQQRYRALPILAVYTGVDPSPWQDLPVREPNGRLVFGHFGVWYPNRRSIRPLLESLRRLADASQIDLARVAIDLWGNGADDATWDAVRELGMEGVVRDRGYLQQELVPVELARVDVALLLAWPEDTYSVPLKVSHYLASGRPVFLLGSSPESEMAAVLEGRPGVAAPRSAEELDAAVLEAWLAAQAGESRSWTPLERPLPFTPASMAEALCVFLRTSVSSAGPEPGGERGA